MGTNVEAKKPDLKRPDREIERTFAGTVLHVGELHKDLLAFQAKMEQRFDRVLGRDRQIPGRFDKIDGKFDRIERELRGLRVDLPKVVRRAIRDALHGDVRTKR